ncbi:hypothetical protein KAM338_40120 [Aeromonas caviae]|jgi:hypothetical protein|uniref:Uncharacterized protein n=3 Tax=Aeromonas TaxID=642 RepID=A0A189PG92_AERSS|nr:MULTISPECIES: hypothetical protein [Aeromonas]ABO92442.1 conserved hypothetical protein [Aeromonas salmonicida subsp. salmonicida A449]ALL42215.1 hypothetical protein [Aeromonas salmonicida subsp. salmonicida]KTA87803.1 hypothetical protein UC37_18595 [Aeromonas salmonicida subsp. salmonicida]OKA75962.1 hypothetical protein BHR40_18610 [Aeromonas salmonicida subsp. salmonicida]BDA15812.1 hypothetical protein KAM339_043530 [Aeromonas caviae]
MNNLSTLETMITRDSAARRFVEQLDKNELSSLSGEIFAKFYWYKRNPQWFKKDTNRQFARLRWIWRIIKKRLSTGRAKPELTVHGSEIERFKHFGGDAWVFFQHQLRAGWEIAFSPSPYSGFWVNALELKLCTYCEGDVVMIKAPNEDVFDRDYGHLCRWYENN